jgi:hypothetical protein
MLEIRHGNHAAAAVQAEQAQALARATGEAVSYLADSGLLALACFEQGDLARARPLLDEGLAILATLPRLATAHHLLNGVDTISELALRFWEHEAPPAGSAAWKHWSRQATLVVSRAAGYARRFAIGAPMAAQHLALSHWLHGRKRQAIAAWLRAVTEGERTGIPYETAKAHLALSQHLDAGDPQRRTHASRAGALFERLGAPHQAARARALSGA